MATIVSFRPGSFEFLPDLREGIERVATGLVNRLDAGPPAALVEGRYSLSPSQYRRALGVGPIAEAPLAAIGFPVIGADVPGIRPTRLDRDEAERRLGDTLFAQTAADCRSPVFDVPEAGAWPSPVEVKSRTAELAASVACFLVELGPQACHTDAIAALVSTLGGRA